MALQGKIGFAKWKTQEDPRGEQWKSKEAYDRWMKGESPSGKPAFETFFPLGYLWIRDTGSQVVGGTWWSCTYAEGKWHNVVEGEITDIEKHFIPGVGRGYFGTWRCTTLGNAVTWRVGDLRISNPHAVGWLSNRGIKVGFGVRPDGTIEGSLWPWGVTGRILLEDKFSEGKSRSFLGELVDTAPTTKRIRPGDRSRWSLFGGYACGVDVGFKKLLAAGVKTGQLNAQHVAGRQQLLYYRMGGAEIGLGIGLPIPVGVTLETPTTEKSPIYLLDERKADLQPGDFAGPCALLQCGADAVVELTGGSWLYFAVPDTWLLKGARGLAKILGILPMIGVTMEMTVSTATGLAFALAQAKAVAHLNTTSYTTGAGISASAYGGGIAIGDAKTGHVQNELTFF